MKYQLGREFAMKMDKEDSIAEYRDQFHFPKFNGDNAMYFNGNSLGLQPKTAKGYIIKELDNWSEHGGEGHFIGDIGWIEYHTMLSEPLAKLVGASVEEVVTMNTLSVNLHLMLVSFYRPTENKYKVLIEYSAFPSDHYAIASQIKLHGYDPKDAIIELRPSDGEIVTWEDIIQIMSKHGDEITLIMIGGVNYYTGQVYDMKNIVKIGKKYNCIVGFDLAHAIGNIKLELHDWDVDFAVWCTYKYLNSGPGSIGGAFIHKKYVSDKNIPRFAGWWGQNKERRFLMEPEFDPITTAEGWQISNQPIFSLVPILASLRIFEEVGFDNLIEKSKKLTAYLAFLINSLPKDQISIITPEERGCQLSLIVKENGKDVFDRLSKNGVFSDWREPDVIRIAPVPLYNSYMDCYRLYELLIDIY